jgi:hypothetical protein
MISRNWALAVILNVALMANAAVHAAEPTSEPANSTTESTVTISAHADAPSCDGLPRDQARLLAQNAHQSGAHRKAAECFRIAGDHAQADRSQLRASADTSAATAERIKANAETAKAQAKQLSKAFRRL